MLIEDTDTTSFLLLLENIYGSNSEVTSWRPLLSIRKFSEVDRG